MKQLHLGNIANVAYGYAKVLRQFGRDADVLCYDLADPISQPEWYEADVPSADPVRALVEAAAGSFPQPQPPDWYRRVRSADGPGPDEAEAGTIGEDWTQALVRFSRRFGDRWAVTEEDVGKFRPLAEMLAGRFFGPYDVIFGYAYAAVPPLLDSRTPFVPVEIGTMREVVFREDSLGRLLALAYRAAPHVVITNPDVRHAADELGLEHTTFVPHPIDEDVWRPAQDEAARRALLAEYGADALLIAPARQNWRLKGNDTCLRAVADLVREGLNVRLIAMAWGQEVERSRRLARDLGLDRHVVWLDPVPEKVLIRLYQAADLVLDQFGYCGTFGLITPKAMACGTPVVLAYDPSAHDWLGWEHPPVVHAGSASEVAGAVRHYLAHPDERRDLGRRSRDWILAHHSKRVIDARLGSVLEEVFEAGGWRDSLAASLKQKRLELAYEAPQAETYDDAYHSDAATRRMDDLLVGLLRRHLDAAGVAAPRILDVGCGPGSLTAHLVGIPGARVTGVDLSPAMIEVARRRHPEAEFRAGDAEALSFDDDAFDVVFCSGVLHHFPRIEPALKEFRRVLRPGGLVVVREPNEHHFAALHPELAFAHLCLKHFLRRVTDRPAVAEPEAHEFHRAFHFARLAEAMAEQFTVIDFRTALMVSYFYNVPAGSAMEEPTRRLDETLEGIPGLHVVLVGRNDGTGGMEPRVRDAVHRLQSPPPVSAEHLRTLFSFAESLFKAYEPRFRDNVQARLGPPDRFLRAAQRLLVVHRDRAQARRLFLGRWHRMMDAADQHVARLLDRLSEMEGWTAGTLHRGAVWVLKRGPAWLWRAAKALAGRLRGSRRRKRTRRPARHVLPTHMDVVQPLDPPHAAAKGRYEAVLLVLDRDLPADTVIGWMQCDADDGLIGLKVPHRLTLTGTEKRHEDYLAGLTALTWSSSPLGGTTLYLTPNLYGPLDFYRALVVAVEREKANVSPEEAEAVDAVLAGARARCRERRAEFSGLDRQDASRRLLDSVFRRQP